MKTAKKPSASQRAAEFFAECKSAGWRIVANREGIVTIVKHFEPNNMKRFVELDGEFYGLLSLVPRGEGSMWGTDGGGVGGYSAVLHGCFTMNVSGVKAPFWNALQSLLAD